MSKQMAKTDEPMLQEPSAVDRPTVPTPSNPTTAASSLAQKNQALNTALDTVPANRLRATIKNLCLISDTVEEHISQLLLTPDENVTPRSKRKHSAADENIEAGNSSKRMRGRYAVCDQCDNEFDVTQNHKRACRYHLCQSTIQPCVVASGLTNSPERVGDLEVDSKADVWRVLGLRGGMRGLEKEHPEGYTWPCCQSAGNNQGCKRGPHRDDTEDMVGSDEDVAEGYEDVSSDTDLEDDEDSNNSEDGGE
jgi:hypothetical protein